MASKKDKKDARKPGPVPLRSDEGLQAVVLADSCLPEFQPLLFDEPLALIDVCGTPAIEYTLEMLARQDVTEIIIFVAQHSAQVRQYLSTSRWGRHLADDTATAVDEPRLRVVSSPGARNSGDALRQLDDMGVLRSDTVVLVDGLVVGNVSLSAALAGHAERVKADSNTIMTVVVTPSAPAGPQSLHSHLAVAVNAVDGQLYSYDPLAFDAAQAPIKAASKWPASVSVRSDLADSHVYICSPEVFIHFSDSYDYQDIRRHYLHNEVTNVDMGFRFYVHVAPDAYARPLEDARAFAAVSRDVAQRRVFPFTPDANWSAPPLETLPPWARTPGGAWVQRGAAVDASAVLGPGVLVCAGATVGPRARVSAGSVLLPGSSVGADARVSASTLMRGSTVGGGATADAAILGRGAALGDGASAAEGSVLGAGVAVAAGVAVPAFARLTLAPAPRDEFGGGDAAAARPAGVPGVSGRLWPQGVEIEDLTSAATTDSDDDEGDDDDDDRPAAPLPASFSAAVVSMLAELRAALAAHRVAVDAAAAARLPLPAPPDAVADLAARLLRTPLVAGSAGTACIDAAIPFLRAAVAAGRAVGQQAAASAAAGAAASPAAASGAAASGGALRQSGTGSQAGGVTATAPPASGTPALGPRTGPAWAAFAAGVRDLVGPAIAAFAASGGKGAVGEQQVRNTALELKSFKYAENASYGDCLAALLPLLLDAVPWPAAAAGAGAGSTVALLQAMKATLAAWAPLLEIFTTCPDDELAAVAAVEAYVLEERHAGACEPLFGLVLHTLFELEVASDVAITAWVDSTEGGRGGPRVQALLQSKWTQRLLESLDEDSEEEDSEEEEGEDDDEED